MVGWIRAEGIFVRVGRTVQVTLKVCGTEQRVGETRIFKKGRGKMGQGLKPAYELWMI